MGGHEYITSTDQRRQSDAILILAVHFVSRGVPIATVPLHKLDVVQKAAEELKQHFDHCYLVIRPVGHQSSV